MIRLSEPADLGDDSNVRKICLPFIAFNYPQSWSEMEQIAANGDGADPSLFDYDPSIPERDNNYLRSIKLHNQTITAKRSTYRKARRKSQSAARRTSKRRNDKFLHDKNPFNIAQRSTNQLQVIIECSSQAFMDVFIICFVTGFTIHGLYSNRLG